MENKKSLLDIYGISVILSGYEKTVEKIASDFKYFLSEKENISTKGMDFVSQNKSVSNDNSSCKGKMKEEMKLKEN